MEELNNKLNFLLKTVNNTQVESQSLVSTLETIKTIDETKVIIDKLKTSVDNIYSSYENKLNSELSELKSFLEKSDTRIDKSWANVVMKNPKPVNNKPNYTVKPVKGSGISQTRAFPPPDTRFEVAPNIYLPAVKIKSPENCHDHLGSLCWSESTRDFWTSVNGFAIRWYATEFHSRDTIPTKIIELDPTRPCPDDRKDNFYKPPEIFPESTDKRHLTNRINFIRPNQKLPHGIYPLKIGDKNTMFEDLQYLNPSDIRFASDVSASIGILQIILLENNVL